MYIGIQSAQHEQMALFRHDVAYHNKDSDGSKTIYSYDINLVLHELWE
jgi:hypothetical protein